MKFVYEPELIEYMQEKGYKNIVVELVMINNFFKDSLEEIIFLLWRKICLMCV